jgi:imidazolonepropionase-like amidohydrolase
MFVIAALGALALVRGPRPPAAGGEGVTVVRAGRIHTGSGPVLDRAIIVIERGRIVDVRTSGEIPEGAHVIDALHQVVIPGLVDAHTSLADGGRDAEETIATDVRAIDGYDFYQSHRRALAGGVTSVYVTPGSQRLVSGLGAVVKTAGRDPRDRVLAATRGLRVTLGETPKNPPVLFKPPVPASADNPILPARRQYPSSRMGEFAALRRAARGPGPLRDRSQPLFVVAHNEDDLIKAVLFAEEAGLRIVLVDAEEAVRVADFLAARKVPVIFNPAYAPGRRDLTDEARPALEATGSLEGAAALARAGVRFALHATDDQDLRELLFIAAAAVRSGLSEAQALAAVTLAPAEILGVADRVGSIAQGKDADLVFLSGDPLSSSSAVQRVMVNGEIVFERKRSDVQTYRAVRDAAGKGKDLLAIRGARILTVTQGILPEGVILVENGKIASVGKSREVPPWAKVIDGTGLTAAPGFIDLDSHLGFHLDRTELGLRRARGATGMPAALVAPPSGLVRLDDPSYREAAASGVTAILLAPDASGVSSVIKLSGQKTAVLREVAALKFSVQGGTGGYQAIKEQLQRGKKYHEDWEAYERAKREPARPATSEAPKAGDPISGTWKGTLEAPEQGVKSEFTAELRLEGTRVSGTIQSQVIGSQPEKVEGTFEGGEVKIERVLQGFKAEIFLRLAGPDHLRGTWKVTGPGIELKGTAEARRTAGGGGGGEAPAVAAKPELKEPRKEEALEPYRKLFAREIPAVVEARDLPAVENATRAFRTDLALDCVILGSPEAAWAGDILFERGAAVAFGPDFLVERRGALVNGAEALASQGIPVAFTSSGLSATRHLPLTAAYAVRHGLDAFDALKAVTIAPARMLKLEGRLGAIERGRDADIVLFAGDPFSVTSRVRVVIIDGRIVYEGK